MSSNTVNSLLGQFRNVGDVFADQVVATPTGEVFHRLNLQCDRPRPACQADRDGAEWQLADPETLHQDGLQPCRACYTAIFEYPARNPTSPVEARTSPVRVETVLDGEGSTFEPVQPTPRPDPLTALTAEVMVTSGSKVMHAPIPTGPYCGRSGDYRRVDHGAVAGHYRPCQDCFVLIDE